MTDDLRSVETKERSVQELFDFVHYKRVVPAVAKKFGVRYDVMFISLQSLILREYLTWDQVEAYIQDSDFDPLFLSDIELTDKIVGIFSRLLNKLNEELIYYVASADNMLLALVQRGVITQEEMDYFMKRSSKDVAPKDLWTQSIDLNNYLREQNKRWARHDWQYLVPFTPDIWFGESEPGDLVFDSSVLAYIGRVSEEITAPTDEARDSIDNSTPEVLDPN